MVRSGYVWEIGHTYETEAGSTAQGRTAEVAAQSHEARDQRLGAREKVEGLCNSAGQHLKMYRWRKRTHPRDIEASALRMPYGENFASRRLRRKSLDVVHDVFCRGGSITQ